MIKRSRRKGLYILYQKHTIHILFSSIGDMVDKLLTSDIKPVKIRENDPATRFPLRASTDIAREIVRRCNLWEKGIPEHLAEFVDKYYSVDLSKPFEVSKGLEGNHPL